MQPESCWRGAHSFRMSRNYYKHSIIHWHCGASNTDRRDQSKSQVDQSRDLPCKSYSAPRVESTTRYHRVVALQTVGRFFDVSAHRSNEAGITELPVMELLDHEDRQAGYRSFLATQMFVWWQCRYSANDWTRQGYQPKWCSNSTTIPCRILLLGSLFSVSCLRFAPTFRQV